MTLIVTDNSPLNILIRVECEEILPKLFSQVLIPPQIALEMEHPSAPRIVREFVHSPPKWLKIQSPKKFLLLERLDPGECAAISLAAETDSPILIDERFGRLIAKEQGLNVVGAIGILERAALDELIQDLGEVHRQILDLNFHIHEEILRQSLERVRLLKKTKSKDGQ